MSTSDKLSYLATTKDKLKTAINYTGANITNDTFRSYPEKLYNAYIDILNKGTQELFDSLPKVQGTGTSITLNNTKEAPMVLNLKGNTQQDSTTGKNKFNKTDYSQIATTNNGSPTNVSKTTNSISFTSNSSSNSSGVYISTANFNSYIDNYSSDVEYTLSADITTNIACSFKFGIDSSSYVNIPIGTTRLSIKRTTGSIVFYVKNATANINITNIMVSTSSDTTYEPYTNGASPNPNYPQDIHIVSGDNTIEICGKNLFDGELEQGGIAFQTGINENANDRVRTKNYISVRPNTTYTIKRYNVNNTQMGLRYYDKNKNYIGYLSATTNEVITFTTRQDGRDIYYVRWIDLENNLNAKYQLELGNQATTYEAYQGQNYPISLGDIELCKIGDYQDYIYKENDIWYLHKEIGKVVLDGTENWSNTVNQVGTSNFYRFSCSDFQDITKYMANTIYISDNFTYATNTLQEKNVIGNTRTADLNRLYITIDTTLVGGTATRDFKTWLSTHNTIVYYVLATPENILLNDTLQETLDSFKSYDGQTNISQTNNDMPFVIKASAIKEYE